MVFAPTVFIEINHYYKERKDIAARPCIAQLPGESSLAGLTELPGSSPDACSEAAPGPQREAPHVNMLSKPSKVRK
jgi:hypothetical protein